MSNTDPTPFPRYYQIAEANAQVGRLSALFEQALMLRIRIKQLIPFDGELKQPAREEDRHAVRGLIETLNETTDEITSLGCVVKDIEIGLVDWPAWHEGRQIWLCWRFGEREVGFWHDVDAGYAGRRPVAELSSPTPPLGDRQDGVEAAVKSSSGQS